VINLNYKILITNGYSWYNKGDSAIVITMAESLRNFLPNSDISIITIYPEEDAIHYKKYNINVIKNIINNTSLIGHRIGMLKSIFKASKIVFCATLYSMSKSYPRMVLTDEEKILLESYIDSDIIISCGGGFIQDSNLVAFLTNIFQIYISILIKKPTVIYAQSIGPFKYRFTKIISKMIINSCSIITLRENISREYLEKMGVTRPKIFVTADSAFTLKSAELADTTNIEKMLNGFNRPFVGITVRKWIFPLQKYPGKKQIEYEMIMAKLIDYLSEKLGATIIFIPQVIAINDDDRMAAKNVYYYVKNKNKFKILKSDYSPEQIKSLIGQMDIFIGTRMHSNIFALSMCIPVIAISYEHKTDGIMSMLGMKEWVVKIDELEYEDMISKIDDIWKKREKLSQELRYKINWMRERSLLNAQLVRDLLVR
jgi:colanic acid/amylovoran biosynthesis protein